MVRRRVLLGYGVAGTLFTLALLLFIAAIAMSSGQTGGIGGVVLGASVVVACVTGAFHTRYYPLDEDE